MTKRIEYLTFDTETDLIGRNSVVPDLVCLTYHDSQSNSSGLLVPWEKLEGNNISDIIQMFMADNEDVEYHLVAHNAKYDFSVLMRRYPELLELFFNWLEQGRVHDTILREKLINLTLFGDMDFIENNGATVAASYTLSSLENKYLGIDREMEKKSADAPRMNYSAMMGIPTSRWPEEYKKYAIEDAVNTAGVFQAQIDNGKNCESLSGFDPFVVECFRVKVDWGLRLLTVVGSCVDKEELIKVREHYTEEYMSDKYRKPLITAKWLEEEKPPTPYKKNIKEHLETCPFHKEHPQYVKGKKADCDCPPKMKKAEKEKNKREPRFDYIFELAKSGKSSIQLLPSDACRKWMKDNKNDSGEKIYDLLVDEEGYFNLDVLKGFSNRFIIEGDKQSKMNFSMDKEWKAENCIYGPQNYIIDGEKSSLLQVWQKRSNLDKMINEYIPKMYYTDEEGNEIPADIVHGSYDCLKKTGRSGCRTNDLFPSRNDQNVDPRIRECTIPREGNVIVSTDYDRMELGTLAQKCFDLFGFSVMKDKINAGVDVHAYLGASIAYAMDPVFKETVDIMMDKSGDKEGVTVCEVAMEAFERVKTFDRKCTSKDFIKTYTESHPDFTEEVMWPHFYEHYRKFAKPTGLGYPGGLGPKTFIGYAKATYGVTVDLETAESLRDIWKDTFPEMPLYLDYVSKKCIDRMYHPEVVYDEDGNPRKIRYYSYETPLGMHKAKSTFCQASNGQALQAFSAEAALEALYRIQKAVWMAEPGSLLDGVIVFAFIHDEIVWESPDDALLGERTRAIEKIMVDTMEEWTPDVKAGAESCAMRRWNKYAKSLWDGDILTVWEPKKEGNE